MTVSAALVEPAFHTAPAYDFTLGPEIGEFCASVGYAPDPEQQIILNDIFAEGDRNLPVVFATAVIGPRRNIKTGVEIQAAIGWLYVLEVPGVQYSAHKWKTASGTFETMAEIIRNSDDLSRRMLRPTRGTGYCRLRLRSGAEMDFATRTLAGGRGEETDKQIFDEALALRSQHTASLIPAMATRPLAQLLYGSSAGLATSDVLREIRDRGRGGRDPRLSYTEYCAPGPEEICDQGGDCTHQRGTPGCGLDKPEFIAIANPQYGRRIPTSFFVDMRNELKPHDYGREVMGWWDDSVTTAALVISAERWADCLDAESEMTGRPRFALDVAPKNDWAAITAVGSREDGLPHIEVTSNAGVIDHRAGTGWVLPRLIAMSWTWDNFAVSIAANGTAVALKPELEAAGITVDVVPAGQVAAACGLLQGKVVSGDLRHIGQEQLTNAATAALRRDVGDGAWTFGRRLSGDITPLYAGALALYRWAENDEPADVSVFGMAELDLCDNCLERPHEDPDGDHDYLCTECRPIEED